LPPSAPPRLPPSPGPARPPSFPCWSAAPSARRWPSQPPAGCGPSALILPGPPGPVEPGARGRPFAAGRLSSPSSRLPAMMKRSHAVIGAAAGVAVAHATGASMVAGGIVAALAGLLPDVDHPHAAVGRLLPRWWHL